MFQLVKALFRRPAHRTAPTTRLAVEALETRATPAALPWVLNLSPELRPVGHSDPEIRPVGYVEPEIRPTGHVSILLPSLKPNDRLGILLPSLRPTAIISPDILPVRHVAPDLLK